MKPRAVSATKRRTSTRSSRSRNEKPPREAVLLRFKYHDAVADIGRHDEIGRVFTDFQKHLYLRRSAPRTAGVLARTIAANAGP